MSERTHPAPACPVCRDTGTVQSPEPDGSGVYDSDCPERIHDERDERARRSRAASSAREARSRRQRRR
jgi:hypothetical protein